MSTLSDHEHRATPLHEDPDYLSLVSSTIEHASRPVKRRFTPRLSSLEKRQGRVLDSLAHLLVSRAEKQVIAIGTVKNDHGYDLLVAENGATPAPDTVAHLENIVSQVQKIHQAAQNVPGVAPRVPNYIEIEAGATDFEREVIELDIMTLRH